MEVDTYRLSYKLSRLPVLHQILLAGRAAVKPLVFALLTPFLGRVTYFKMGTISNKNCDFQRDPLFVKAYDAAMKQQYMPDTDVWRYHVNHWAVKQALELDGDFVECGVYKGSTAMSNIVYTGFGSLKNRKYYLFDTFDGLDREVASTEEYSRLDGKYPDCYEFVVGSFRKYQNVVIVKGAVPKTLSSVKISKVSYLSLDMNCAAAEEAALAFFWPKLVPGGIVVFDDYGWPMCEAQKEAADRFARSVAAMILSLPNGQGILIK